MITFKGRGVVWDSSVDKALCRFVDGEFSTDDAEVIEKLEARGYVGEETFPENDTEPLFNFNLDFGKGAETDTEE